MGNGSAPDASTLEHQGKGFSLSSVLSIGIAGTTTFVGIPDAVEVHFHNITFDSDAGPVLIEFIEAPTVTVTGTPVAPYNRRRDSGNDARMKIYGGATVTGGDVLFSAVMYGNSAGINAAAKPGLIDGQWILDPAKTYAIRVTNQSGQAISISMDMHFYEDDI